MMNDKRNEKKKFDSVMLEFIYIFFFRSDAGKNTPKKKKDQQKRSTRYLSRVNWKFMSANRKKKMFVMVDSC